MPSLQKGSPADQEHFHHHSRHPDGSFRVVQAFELKDFSCWQSVCAQTGGCWCPGPVLRSPARGGSVCFGFWEGQVNTVGQGWKQEWTEVGAPADFPDLAIRLFASLWGHRMWATRRVPDSSPYSPLCLSQSLSPHSQVLKGSSLLNLLDTSQ